MNDFAMFLLGVAVAVSACGLGLWRCRKRQQARIRALVSYLEAAACGRATTLASVEDEFSLLEDVLNKTVNELWIAREQAQNERRRLAENLADVAHQLKTPLTSMSLMNQLLANECTEPQLEYTRRLGSQLDRLEWLTGSLLTMSRLESGAVEFVPSGICFEELAARAAEPVELLLRDREQTLVVSGGNPVIECDQYWTAEALVNLLKNCSEHTPQGGQLQLFAETTPLYTQITVEDNGCGFETNELPHIFQRFFHGKNAHKESVGIGLSLSKAIIEGQGGIIRAENRIEGGARFVIRFYPNHSA